MEGAVKRRRHKPIFMVDLAVPRDIETQVAELADVYLYSIDDLEQIVADNRKAREDASEVAEELIEAGLLSWEQARRGLDAVGALREVRASVESMRDREVEKALNQLRAGADPEQLLAQVARNLTNKFLHQPSVQLRKAASDGRSELLDWGRRLLVGGGGGSDE